MPIKPRKPPLKFLDEYRQEAFLIWYENNKPSAVELRKLIINSFEETAVVPSAAALSIWISTFFIPKAYELDLQVSERLDEKAIASKVEMMNRHAQLGREMQTMGIEYLREKGLGSSRNAIVALVHGFEIERQSNVPTDFEKLEKMTDDALLDELKKLATNSVVEISPNSPDGLKDE